MWSSVAVDDGVYWFVFSVVFVNVDDDHCYVWVVDVAYGVVEVVDTSCLWWWLYGEIGYTDWSVSACR